MGDSVKFRGWSYAKWSTGSHFRYLLQWRCHLANITENEWQQLLVGCSAWLGYVLYRGPPTDVVFLSFFRSRWSALQHSDLADLWPFSAPYLRPSKQTGIGCEYSISGADAMLGFCQLNARTVNIVCAVFSWNRSQFWSIRLCYLWQFSLRYCNL